MREVSEATGSFLLDLEPQLDAVENLDRLFLNDGIHFTHGGLMLIAKKVVDSLDSNRLLPAGSP